MIMSYHNQHYQSFLCSFDCYKLLTADKLSLKRKFKCQEPN